MNYLPVPTKLLDVLRGYNAYQLAGDADCSTPDRLDSAGALFLLSVRDGVVDRLEHFDEDDLEAWALDDGTINDVVHEVADDAPDVYTHTLWSEFVDLAAYQEDPTDYGVDASDMEQCARVCLYAIAERLATALFDEVRGPYVEFVESQELDAEDIPEDWPVQPDDDGDSTCETCGLSWHDDVPTSLTPVPSGRCPFESFHHSID